MNIIKSITPVIGIVVVAIIAFFALQTVNRSLDLRAIHDCASDYRTEYTDTNANTKVIRPLEAPFRQCVWNKGVTSWQGTK